VAPTPFHPDEDRSAFAPPMRESPLRRWWWRQEDTIGELRVVVADDDVLLREGLASLLDRSGFVVAGKAGDATELLALTPGAAAAAGDRRHRDATDLQHGGP